MSWSGEVWASMVNRKDTADRLEKVLKGPSHERDRLAATWERFGKLPPTTREVLVLLAKFESNDKGYAWASMRKLARELDRSLDTVQRAMRELRRRGLLEERLDVAKDNAGNQARGHCYRLKMPAALRAKDRTWNEKSKLHGWSRLDRLPGVDEWGEDVGATSWGSRGATPDEYSAGGRTAHQYGAVLPPSTGPY